MSGTASNDEIKFEVATDERASNYDEKCSDCWGKAICTTNCCNRKLCQFHIRFYKDDDEIIECEFCTEKEETEHKGRPAYFRKDGFIFCAEHHKGELTFCDECEFYYCRRHYSENGDRENHPTPCHHGWETLEYDLNTN